MIKVNVKFSVYSNNEIDQNMAKITFKLPSKHETFHFVSNLSQKRRFKLNIYKMFLKHLFGNVLLDTI